ncbi:MULTISPECIES: hypothetical protein [unclassified Sphingomonas]|uniref:hypothetical protein n=1 Tax=unclassified Sphingomonas TaxID=196159 RepID=UPI000835F035|nr:MULTISPECIES: hypothetical protein [unclassified Sphingomonas]
MSYLQIASWNIEHLGGTRSNQLPQQSVFALAEHIEMSGIDVIALQEIYVTPTDEEVRLTPGGIHIDPANQDGPRNKFLDMVCYLLEEHLDRPWRYRIVPNRDAGQTKQLCAVMWDAERLTLAGVAKLDVAHDSDAGKLWARAPHLFDFTSQIEVFRKDATGAWVTETERRRLSLVPLHMKSNVGGETVNRKVRAREAEELCKALRAADGTFDPSLVLIGDTNIVSNAEPAIETFLANGLIDLNNNDTPTYVSLQRKGAPFDRAFVAAGRKEFRYSRQYVLHSADLLAHDRFLSDHHMIKICVKDYVDDLDPRTP